MSCQRNLCWYYIKHGSSPIKAEFKIFKELSHPNTASIYDFGYDHERNLYFFTSELFTEGNLLTALGEPIQTIESYLLQALRALEYLRNRGILHLDIKPQNLMLYSPSPLHARLRQRRISATQLADRRLRRKRSSGGRGEGGPARRSLLPAEALAKAGGEGGGERAHEPARHASRASRGEAGGRTSARAHALLLLGDAYEQARLWDKAIDTYKLLKMTPLWHEGLIKMGLAYSKQRRPTEGRRCFKQALEVVPKGAFVERITIKNYLAAIDMREGKFKEAYRQYLNNLRFDKKLPLKVRPANNELGEVLYHMGLHAKAERILKQNLKLHSARRLSERVANTYYLLGLVFKDKSEFSRAYEHFLLARKAAKRHHLFETLLRVESGLGDAAYNEAKFTTAVEHYQEGLKLAQQLSAKETSIELIVNLGIAASKCGQLSLAKECLESTSEARIAKRHLPAIYTVLADIYFNEADYERAKAVILKARKLEAKQKLAPAIRYSIHGTLADIYLAQGRPELARREIPFLKRLANTLPGTRAHFKELLKRTGRGLCPSKEDNK